MLMTNLEAARAANGILVGPDGAFDSVSIDSRAVKQGALFVALRGQKTDGHQFVRNAFEAGAVTALVEEKPSDIIVRGHSCIIVDDTLHALQAIAAAYLDMFPALLKVGVTGSNGKTTTKELAARIIGQERAVVYNEGNLNSETGLPLAVFHTKPEHQVGIFELGMNRKGEIRELADVLRPQIALITNIGSAHIGIIGSKQGIALEKKALFATFTGHEIALIPEQNEFSALLSEGVRGTVRFFGPQTQKDTFKVLQDRGLAGYNVSYKGREFHFPLAGAHNVQNALAAIAIAETVGVSADAICQGLSQASPLFGRGEILEEPVEGGSYVVIRDCYNASPESAASALALCDSLVWPGRKIYVFGSMLELGKGSESAHEHLGELLALSKADAVFLFGRETEVTSTKLEASCGRFSFFQTNDITILKEKLQNFARAGDLVLLKASRGCALERVLQGT